MHDWRTILWHVGGENKKKKLNCQFFCLVGPVSSTLEDSSIVEYSECGLTCLSRMDFVITFTKPYVVVYIVLKER